MIRPITAISNISPIAAAAATETPTANANATTACLVKAMMPTPVAFPVQRAARMTAATPVG